MTHAQLPVARAAADDPTLDPPAGMDRRFYAFFLDRLWAWLVYAGAAAAAYHWLIDPGRLLLGVVAIVATVLLVGLLTSLAVGLAGTSPANAVLGLRVVSVDHGGPIGVGRALLRTLILGAATLPTFGFGTAALAWTAVVDPTGRRRGWHDLRAHSEVVDVRPVPVEEEPEDEPPSQLVNLTAMRLVPASPHPPREAPVRRSRLARQAAAQAAARTATETATAPQPRQGLGWPLVGPAPDLATGPATLGPKPAAPPAPQPAPPPAPPPAAAREVPAPTLAPPPAPPQRPAAPAVPHPAPPVPPAPAPPTPPTPPAALPAALPAPLRWQVSFDTGEAFEVRGLTLVGRHPEARAGEPVKQVVTLPSSDMSLSKTHAQFQVVPDGALVVMDRGSTNGSVLVRNGVAKRLEGGRPATLREGDRVRFGDREMTVARLG